MATIPQILEFHRNVVSDQAAGRNDVRAMANRAILKDALYESAGAIVVALQVIRKIAQIRYGLELADTDEATIAYWSNMALDYRASAAAAHNLFLDDRPPSPFAN